MWATRGCRILDFEPMERNGAGYIYGYIYISLRIIRSLLHCAIYSHLVVCRLVCYIQFRFFIFSPLSFCRNGSENIYVDLGSDLRTGCLHPLVGNN